LCIFIYLFKTQVSQNCIFRSTIQIFPSLLALFLQHLHFSFHVTCLLLLWEFVFLLPRVTLAETLVLQCTQQHLQDWVLRYDRGKGLMQGTEFLQAKEFIAEKYLLWKKCVVKNGRGRCEFSLSYKITCMLPAYI